MLHGSSSSTAVKGREHASMTTHHPEWLISRKSKGRHTTPSPIIYSRVKSSELNKGLSEKTCTHFAIFGYMFEHGAWRIE